MDEQDRRSNGEEDTDIKPLSTLIKAYIDQQIQDAIKKQEEALPKKKKWRNSWRATSLITKASLFLSLAAVAATIAYTIAAWRTLVVMRQISTDSSAQTAQLIDAANQMKAAAWGFRGSAQGIDGNIGSAVGKLQLQVDQIKRSADAAKTASDTAKRQLALTEKQFEIAERPMVSVTPQITKFEWSEDSAGQTTLNLEYQIIAVNTGPLPAMEVYSFNDPYVMPFEVKDLTEYLNDKEAGFCANSIKRGPGAFQSAVVLYPNRPSISLVAPEMKSTAANSTWLKEYMAASIVLSGCVTYRSSPLGKLHQSGFIFAVMKKGKNGEQDLINFRDEVPLDSLVLRDLSGIAYSD